MRGSGGANDNAAAIVTCLAVIEQYVLSGNTNPLQVLFFDEEETGRKGSQAYVRRYGHQYLHALINLELVGIGSELLIWPIDKPNDVSRQLEQAWQICFPGQKSEILHASSFPIFYSDADSIIDNGMQLVLTLTRLTSNDYNITARYLAEELSDNDFMQEVSRCDIMRTYHQPQDTASTIDSKAIKEKVLLLIHLISQFVA